LKKRISPAQIAANQRNAQKSTGPKTEEGKSVSKFNALKHGILSKEVLVRGLKIKENPREFSALHQQFRESLEPVGPIEEMLVDQIVTARWRLRRALAAESGEIALNVDDGYWSRHRGTSPTLQWMQWDRLGDTLFNMQDSSMGNSIIERRLGEVRSSVEREGDLTEAAIEKFVQSFGGKPNYLSLDLEELRLKLQKNPDGLDAAALKERNKKRALAHLDSSLEHALWQRRQCFEHEDKAEEARQAAAVLPSMEVLEKIMRYETKLERQMYRAMGQLERLQRMRRGETVPPPMAVVT
jgi:hypothetical protein